MSLASPSPSEYDPCAVVMQLVEVVCDERPLAVGEAIVHRDVVLHLDENAVRGRGHWRRFVRYVRHRWRRRDLALVVDETAARGEDVTVRGHVLDRATGAKSAFSLRFRLADGRVVEVWSSRANYVGIHGRRFTRRWGFAWFLVQWYCWLATHPGTR